MLELVYFILKKYTMILKKDQPLHQYLKKIKKKEK